MQMIRIMTALLVGCMFFSYGSGAALAASISYTDAVRSAFDKTIQSAAGTAKTRLQSQRSELLSLLAQDTQLDGQIKALHYKNAEEVILLRKQIRVIDADKLAKLDGQLKQLQEKHKPLFDRYAALNRQISAIKPLKNKELNAVYRAQADVMKVAVQLAREQIRAKTAERSKARAATAAVIKKLRGMLDEIAPLNVRIKAERSAADLPKQSAQVLWSNVSAAVKRTDADGAAANLAALLPLLNKIVDKKQAIYVLEQKGSGILNKTRALIPK